MPAQAGARYLKNERISAAAVEEGWIRLWRQVDPLPMESKADVRRRIIWFWHALLSVQIKASAGETVQQSREHKVRHGNAEG